MLSRGTIMDIWEKVRWPKARRDEEEIVAFARLVAARELRNTARTHWIQAGAPHVSKEMLDRAARLERAAEAELA